MILAWLALAVVAAFAAALFVPRLARHCRVPVRAGAAVVSPQRTAFAGEAAVPAAAAVPYEDGCLITGERL